jgi:hypothetical protein
MPEKNVCVNFVTPLRNEHNQSFGYSDFQKLHPLFLNMLQLPCKGITFKQPESLVCVTPLWQQTTAYSHLILSVVTKLFLVLTFSKEPCFAMCKKMQVYSNKNFFNFKLHTAMQISQWSSAFKLTGVYFSAVSVPRPTSNTRLC